MTINDLEPGWTRGLLEPCVLAVISHGATYGYDVRRQLAEAGFQELTGGSLYPALRRLEAQGLLEAEWQGGDGGPGRRWYRLTPEGELAVAKLPDVWAAFAGVVGGLLVGVHR